MKIKQNLYSVSLELIHSNLFHKNTDFKPFYMDGFNLVLKAMNYADHMTNSFFNQKLG